MRVYYFLRNRLQPVGLRQDRRRHSRRPSWRNLGGAWGEPDIFTCRRTSSQPGRVPPQAAQEGLPKCGDRFRAPLSQTGTKSVTTFDFCIFGSLEAFTAMNPRKLLERMRLKILEHPVLPPSLVPAFNNIKGWGGCGGSTPEMVFFPRGG